VVAFRLPVSGLDVTFRQTSGAEDILLAEEEILDIRLALALLGALTLHAGGGDVSWEAVPISDLDAALLAIRRSFIGDQVRTTVICADAVTLQAQRTRGNVREKHVAGCRARIDVEFRVGDYLAHHAPVLPRGLSLATEPGWFQLDGTEVTCRVPTCADQMAALGCPDADRELSRRCVRPQALTPELWQKVNAAMAKLAPSLAGDLDGRCPECSAPVAFTFDPIPYVLAELRARAMFIYEEVHLIAEHYRWSEREILALPGARRARYAEFVHEARAAQ
jgi:hypothetical protein